MGDIKAACERARTSVSASTIIQETDVGDQWLFAKTYFDRQAREAASEVVPRWIDRLGGVQAFTHDH